MNLAVAANQLSDNRHAHRGVLHRVFLLPGLFGDEPKLVALRARMAGLVAMILVDLPGIGDAGAVLTDMRATAAAAVRTIVERQPEGPIALVGFSFGGSVALEVAHQLTAAGRAVSFLGVLDAPFRTDELPGLFRELIQARSARSMVRVVVSEASRQDAARRVVMAGTGETLVGPGRSPVRRAVLTHLRNKALAGWTPEPCLAAGIHVSSGAYGPGNRGRWAALCPNLRHVEIAGQHEDLLLGTHFERVVAVLRDNLAPVSAAEA